jgi:hypothetical protein
MKLSKDALICIIEALRKGLTENADISDLLRQLDLEPDKDNLLTPTAPLQDIWK